MDEEQETWIAGAFFLVAGLLHAGAWTVLGTLPKDVVLNERAPTAEVELAVVPPPEPIPEVEPERETPPPPEPPPEPLPERPRVRREVPAQQPEVTEPPTPEPPPVEEAIADFTNETITNEDSSWRSAVGNGVSSDQPIGQPNAVRTGRNRQGSSSGAVGGSGTPQEGPRVVAITDLSRQPRPQGDLDALLRRNYPPRARQLGIEGRAEATFRIMPDGTTSRVRIRSEDPPDQEFGQHCRRAIEQSRWDPPIHEGNAVATDARFICDFGRN